MERSGRWLGWIAIALGALALVIALGVRVHLPAWPGFGPPTGFYGPPAAGPGWQAPAEGRGYQDRWRGHDWAMGPRHVGPGWFFLLPFFWIGKLARLALFALLVVLALKLLGGGRGSSARGGGRSGPDQPGPEPPPYTSQTQSL